LAEAAQAVAAHLRLAAVGVEHAHAGVGPFGGADEDEAVGADPEMTITHHLAELGRIFRRRVVDAIDVEVIVAEAVHLHEFHHQCPFTGAGAPHASPLTPRDLCGGACHQTTLPLAVAEWSGGATPCPNELFVFDSDQP